MDLATVLLLHKCSFLVGALCFVYLMWRSRELGLKYLAVGEGMLAMASTLAGSGEQGSLPKLAWTFGSFSIGITGYAFMTMGLLRLSGNRQKNKDWLLVLGAVIMFTVVGSMHWYVESQTRAAIFNANVAVFLGLSCVVILKDFPLDGLSARWGLLASFAAAMSFSILIAVTMTFPQYELIEPRYAFFMLIFCHFSISLFVVVLVQERMQAQLERLANTDALTGIPNRQHFLASLPRELQPGDAFIMLDIDHFKSVNDRFGHETGDLVLVSVAKTIAAAVDGKMALGRLGGEEFAVFLRDQSEETAIAVGDQIRRSVNALKISTGSGIITQSVSAGVAVWDGECNKQKLRDLADQALYLAKRNGRNRVELYVSSEFSAGDNSNVSAGFGLSGLLEQQGEDRAA